VLEWWSAAAPEPQDVMPSVPRKYVGVVLGGVLWLGACDTTEPVQVRGDIRHFTVQVDSVITSWSGQLQIP